MGLRFGTLVRIFQCKYLVSAVEIDIRMAKYSTSIHQLPSTNHRQNQQREIDRQKRFIPNIWLFWMNQLILSYRQVFWQWDSVFNETLNKEVECHWPQVLA